MPIAPRKPQQWVCVHCSWRAAPVMKTDVLTPSPEKCPKCGHGDFVLQSRDLLGVLQKLWS